MLLHIEDAKFYNREQNLSIQGLNLCMDTHQWVTIKSEHYGISKDFLRGLNAQGSTTWKQWDALGMPLSQWDASQYRSVFPLVTNEPIGWSGSVEQALKIPFYWKNHQKKIWPQSMIEEWIHSLGFSKHVLKKQCDIFERHDLLKLSLIRALSLQPTVLLIDDIWTAFSSKEYDNIFKILNLWLHPVQKSSRAIITIDQNNITSHSTTHHYSLTQNGLTALKKENIHF